MSSPRFYSSSPTSKSRMQKRVSAYVMPYETNDQGEICVLVGQKKVICYEAKEQLETYYYTKPKESEWDRLKQSIKAIKANKDENFDRCMASRFRGLFFHAGGRPTCFGGHVDNANNEDAKTTAARELLEESGLKKQINEEEQQALMKEIQSNLDPLYEVDHDDFKGTYFSLDLAKCPQLQAYLAKHVEKENIRILENENTIDNLSYPKRKEKKLVETVSEMHKLEWVNLPELSKYLGKKANDPTLRDYITNELIAGVNVLFSYLFDKRIEPEIPQKQKMKIAEYICDHVKKESNEENLNAAKALQEKLSPKKESEIKAETSKESQNTSEALKP